MMKFWDKDSSINILNYKNIDFIAAGGISFNDLKTYKYLGYKAVVIGNKAIKNKNSNQKYVNGSKIIKLRIKIIYSTKLLLIY